MRFSPSANSRQATLPGALPRIALQPCDMFSRILARSWNPVMALLPQCGTAEDATHFSEVWNLLIHKRTANRIFSTTFSIFFFYQKYIHTHIFSQTGVDLNPTRFLILIGCHKVNRKTQKWYLFIQHAHLIFLTAFQPFHQLTLSFGSAHSPHCKLHIFLE